MALAVQWGIMKNKISTLEERMERGSSKLDEHSSTDTRILESMARVETKVDNIDGRVKRIEDKVLNGHG